MRRPSGLKRRGAFAFRTFAACKPTLGGGAPLMPWRVGHAPSQSSVELEVTRLDALRHLLSK